MGKLFSINEIVSSEPIQEDKNDVLVNSFLGVHDAKIKSLQELVPAFPSKNEIMFLWTLNSFNAFTFIPYIIKTVGNIDEIIVTTYSINISIIDSFSKFLSKGNIKNAFILISDSANFRIPKVMDHLKQFEVSHSHNASIRYAWNHSKVTLIRCKEHFFVIEGSGNFSTNSRHEQYVFLDSENVYNFRKKWITNELYGRSN